MRTQMEAAREGRVTPEVAAAASADSPAGGEGREPEDIARDVAAGLTVVPWNASRGRDSSLARAIGRGLATKTNANLGTSADLCDLDAERAKLRAAEEAGADSVMDLSTGGDLRAIRRALVSDTSLAFGSVPIYDAAVEATAAGGTVLEMTPESMLAAVRRALDV